MHTGGYFSKVGIKDYNGDQNVFHQLVQDNFRTYENIKNSLGYY